MKHLFFTLTILVIAITTSAQDINFSNKLIEKYENGRNQLKSSESDIKNRFWLTPLLMEAKQNWNILSDEAKDIFGELTERPEFAGTEKIATYTNFAFHYSVDGSAEESVDPTDLNNSGIPDYVERMAFIFGDYIDSLYHKATKLALPPNDEDQVNDAYYDVYINGNKANELGAGTYGYVSPENLIGDNPNSNNQVEVTSSTSFMVMRNNYNDFGKGEEICIRVTAAHEYMHAIQMGYDYEMESWLMEAAATWAEEFAYPGDDDNFQYLSSVFLTPDVALNYEDGEDSENVENDGHWYGSWLFMQYLTEHTSKNIIKNIYEECIVEKSIYAIDRVLTNEWESDFATMFIQYVISNSLLGTEFEFAPFAYKRGFDYFNSSEEYIFQGFEGTLDFIGEEINFSSIEDGNNRLMRLSYENYYLESNDNFKIIFTPKEPSTEVDILLIKYSIVNGTSIQASVGSENSSSIVITDNDKWDYYIPVVLRLDVDIDDIDPIDYDLVIKNANTTNILEREYSNNIYPNPATDKINIEVDGMNSALINIELFDLTGKRIFTEQAKNKSTIDVSNIIDGMYVLKISNEQGLISISKQIIK